jgi:isopentenyl-diphosphate Delta-isomerase
MPAPSPSTTIDRVDEADQPISEVTRAEVFSHPGLGFRVVHIFVFDDEGKLLLQRLGGRRDRNPLKLGSSVAGYLNLGEEYLDAARRRLKEELGLSTPLAKFGSVVMPDQGARKFITLYITRASQIASFDENHIAGLRFETVPAIREQVQLRPDDFTETFRFLFQFYLSVLRLTGVGEWKDLGTPPSSG